MSPYVKLYLIILTLQIPCIGVLIRVKKLILSWHLGKRHLVVKFWTKSLIYLYLALCKKYSKRISWDDCTTDFFKKLIKNLSSCIVRFSCKIRPNLSNFSALTRKKLKSSSEPPLWDLLRRINWKASFTIPKIEIKAH